MKNLGLFKRIIILIFALALLNNSLFTVTTPQNASAQSSSVYDDFLPNSLQFPGRRSTSNDYTVYWDATTYTFTFTPPAAGSLAGTFPWDWISFVGTAGSVALNGYPDLRYFLEYSEAGAMDGARPGDIFRIKGTGYLSLAHLTKIGLVIGSGAGAQRAWLSDGTITQYVVAPGYVGYTVQVLGRNATVCISSLNPQNFVSVAVIQVTLDNPSDADVILASDLEPSNNYDQAVIVHNTNSTYVRYENGSIIGEQDTGRYHDVYLYASTPLQSYSGNNLALNSYLSGDSLDNITNPSTSGDGRSALRVDAQLVQYFYIGSTVLDTSTRENPTTALNALRDSRLAQLAALPTIDAEVMPKFKFVNLFSNLVNVYLINPNGNLFYTDKAFFYAPDILMPLVFTPHLLPPAMLENYKAGLNLMATQQYSDPVTDYYSFKRDVYPNRTSIPTWYSGNFPDIVFYNQDRTPQERQSFSDVYATAEFINGVYEVYETTADTAFANSTLIRNAVIQAVAGMRKFDSGYDLIRGEDGNFFPNVFIPMGDLAQVSGEYPGETAQLIYAYEDAARLYSQVYGIDASSLISEANDMRAGFNARFWDDTTDFFLGRADLNNLRGKADGSFYYDYLTQSALAPLRGTAGQEHRSEMLATMTHANFYESSNLVHWMAKGSENFAWPGRWNISIYYTNGWNMEGGFLVMSAAIAPIGYYQIDQISQAENYANRYFDQWAWFGPHEIAMRYTSPTVPYTSFPWRFFETSMYSEASASTTWLLQEALGLQIDGLNVSVTPKLSGRFVVRDLHITSQGQTAEIQYARDDNGCEFMEVLSNTGLTIEAPNLATTFTGSGNGSDAGNWDRGIPNAEKCAIIPTGHHVQLSADMQSKQLTVEAGAVLDIGQYAFAVDTGVINHAEIRYSKQVNAAACTTQGCPFNIPNLTNTQTVYAGIVITPTGGDQNMGLTTVSIRGNQTCGDDGTLGSMVLRCFEISPEHPLTATITFHYEGDSEAHGNTTPNVWHYQAGIWEDENEIARGNHGNDFYVSADGIDHYSPFALGDGNTPTALNLLSLQASSSRFGLLLPGIMLGMSLLLFHRLFWRRRTMD